MALNLGPLIYAILQFIAFFFVMVGTPIDMFRIKREISHQVMCVTLWGFKWNCNSIKIDISSDRQWANCPSRSSGFQLARIFAVASIFSFGLAFAFGVLLLFCCSAFRWVCLTLSIFSIIFVCVVWVFMVLIYNTDEPKCEPLRKSYTFGAGFGLYLVAWVLDIIAIIFLLLPLQIADSPDDVKEENASPESVEEEENASPESVEKENASPESVEEEESAPEE